VMGPPFRRRLDFTLGMPVDVPLEEATSREAAITYGAVDVKEDRTKLLPRDGQYRGSITAGDVAQAARLGDKLNNSYKRLARFHFAVGTWAWIGIILWITHNERIEAQGEDDLGSQILIWSILGSTIITILLLFCEYYTYYQTLLYRSVDLRALPTLTGMLEMGVLTPLLVEVLILLVQPYAFFNHLIVEWPSPWTSIDTFSLGGNCPTMYACYRVNSFVGILMLLLRTYFIGRLSTTFSKFGPSMSRTMAITYDVNVSLWIMFKQVINDSFIFSMLCFVYLLFIYGYACFVFDRVAKDVEPPADGSRGFFNAVWMVMVTMTTVGYGDVLPHTYGGRCVLTLAALNALIVFAVIIQHVTTALTPSRQEIKLVELVTRMNARQASKDAAASVIQKGFKLWRHQSKHDQSSPLYESELQIHRAAVRRAVNVHREQRSQANAGVEDDVALTANEIMHQVGWIAKEQEAMKEDVDSLKGDMKKLVESVQAMAVSMKQMQGSLESVAKDAGKEAAKEIIRENMKYSVSGTPRSPKIKN